jgi:EmrB/QacA subfamily drug resistance transporter
MRKWLPLVAICLGTFMLLIDVTIVNVALPDIARDLGTSFAQLQWVVDVYALALAALVLGAGSLADLYGRRRLYLAGLVVFAVSSLACGLAPDAGWLIAARAVQGAGSALIMPLGLALLSGAFPPEKRGAAIGMFSAVTGVAVASGPLVGGAIVNGLAWQWIFWINVPIGLLSIPFVLAKLDESHGPDTSLDIRGLTLITTGALGLVWGLVRGNQIGWTSVEVIATLAAGALLVAAFVAWERRAREPMLPLRFFRDRAFSAGNAAIFMTFASLFAAVFFFAQLLQTGLGYDALGTGLRLIPWTATFITIAPAAGALADRIGERPLMVAGLTLQAAGLAWVALIAEPGMAYTQLLAPFIVAGVGVSMAIPAAQNSVVGSIGADALGKAAGANSMMRELGGVFGIAVAVAVFGGAGGYASASQFVDGFGPAIGVAAGLSLIGAIVGLALPRRREAAPALIVPVAIIEEAA